MSLISDTELVWWNARTPFRYQRMLWKHRRLWKYVKRYILQHEIQSILEAGCGLMPPARQWVPQYQGVDLNERADALHEDFLRLDLAPWVGVDLFLACGVMEHMGPEYRTFLQQIALVRPKHALVSFFQPLMPERSSYRWQSEGYWLNRFCEQDLLDWTAAAGMMGRIERISRRDAVLVIEGGGE